VSNPVVHFEILGPDGAALQQFYRQLFGWQLHDGQLPGWPHYGLLRADDAGISGAVGTADAADEPAVVVYVEVDDPEAYLERAEKLGATVAMPATHVADAEVTVGLAARPSGQHRRCRQEPRDNAVGIVEREVDGAYCIVLHQVR